MAIVHVYPISDPDYKFASLVTVDGKRLPMGQGCGKSTSRDGAIKIATSNAGLQADQYTIVDSTYDTVSRITS